MRALWPAASLLGLGVLLIGSGGRDDAHITYGAARALAASGQILNYNGQPVEQSSSLLQVILLALAYRWTAIDVVTLGKLSSIFGGALTVWLAGRLASRLDAKTGVWAALFVALSAPVVYWSFGGLESTLASAIAIGFVLALGRYLETGRGFWSVALSVALFATVRPEGALVAGGTAGLLTAVALVTRQTTGRALTVAAASAVALGALVWWRLLTFGSSFPQPVIAKSGGLHLDTGLDYVLFNLVRTNAATALVTGAVLVGLGLVLVRAHAQPTARAAIAYLVTAGGFVVATGGDWMEAGRFLVPVWPVALVLGAVGLSTLPRFSTAALAGVVVVSLASTVTIIARHSTGTPLWANGLRAPGYSWFETRNRLGWRDITVTAALEGIIRERKQHRPVRILTGQMGMVPYHLTQRFGTRVQWIDRYGLSDRAFTDCPLTTGRFGGRSGMRISYAFYLSKRDRFKTECGIVEPDLIFDLGDEDRAVVETFGYQLLYRRAGMIESGTWPSGSPVNGNAWVAMKPPTDVGR